MLLGEASLLVLERVAMPLHHGKLITRVTERRQRACPVALGLVTRATRDLAFGGERGNVLGPQPARVGSSQQVFDALQSRAQALLLRALHGSGPFTRAGKRPFGFGELVLGGAESLLLVRQGTRTCVRPRGAQRAQDLERIVALHRDEGIPDKPERVTFPAAVRWV